MSITIRDIARQLNVSPMTVSYALRDSSQVSEATRKRVRKAAGKLNYRPNASARSIARGRFNAVGMLLGYGTGKSTLPEQMLRAVMDRLAEKELHLVMAAVPDERLSDPEYIPRILREYAVDAMLVNYTHGMPARMIDLIRRAAGPAVWINTKLDADCVYPDDFAAGRAAAQRLIDLGHKHIVFVNFSHGWKTIHLAHYNERDRQAGYEEAMTTAGLEPRVFMADDYVEGGERAAVARRVLREVRPTGVVALSSAVAMSFLYAAARMGIFVPRELSVITFAPEYDRAALGAAMDAMVQPEAELGAAAADLLVRKIAHPQEEIAPRLVPFRCADGTTCGPFAAS